MPDILKRLLEEKRRQQQRKERLESRGIDTNQVRWQDSTYHDRKHGVTKEGRNPTPYCSDCDKGIHTEDQHTDNWTGETLCKDCAQKRNFKLEP